MWQKIHSIKIQDYLNVVKPKYIYLKLTPNNSIRNNNTHKIAQAIASTYTVIWNSIRVEQAKAIKVLGKNYLIGTKYEFKEMAKVSYYIYIEKKRVEFYFILPQHHMSIIKERITDVWTGITTEEVDAVPEFGEDATKYQLSYQKEDGLSLRCDKRDNDLLRSNLNIIDVMEEGDKVGIFYNFIPMTQFSWASTYKNTITKVKKGVPVEKSKMGIGYMFKLMASLLGSLSNSVSEVVQDFGGGKNIKDGKTRAYIELALDRLNNKTQISESTYKKGKSTILGTQIVLLSESEDALREKNNCKSLAQSFNTIAEDNKLIAHKLKKPFNMLKYNVGVAINKASVHECSNFLALAGRDILEQYNFIDKVVTTETQVPEALQTGDIRLGTNTFRGNPQQAYMSTDKEYKYLTYVLIGPTRAGKTTLISNMSKDAINNDECVILFDFCGTCELSDEVSAIFPRSKILDIDCKEYDTMQGLGYNEVRYTEDTFKQYTNAKTQATQLKTLVNSINADDKPLSSKMGRYLTSASLVVFISGGSIKDVFDVLQNFKKRHKFLNKIPQEQKENFEEYVDFLNELDDTDRNGETTGGTRLHLITGIIDRLTVLKDNPYMELMLKKGCEDNIDLVDEMEKNQLICLRMQEEMFSTDSERDVYCTYWITKIWMALQIRKAKIKDRSKMKKVNLFIDELYQTKHTEAFLTSKLSRLAKFNLKPIISCHYLNQIKIIREELRSANASYMLISGCDRKNFDELHEELHPYTSEDLLKLERYKSINYIKYKDGYAKFITLLPPEIKKQK